MGLELGLDAAEENRLLRELNQLYAERGEHVATLERLDAHISATEDDLEFARAEALDEFIADELSVRNLSFTRSVSDKGETLLDVRPQADGAIEYGKMQQGTGYTDLTALPLPHLLAYLGKGLPWAAGFSG